MTLTITLVVLSILSSSGLFYLFIANELYYLLFIPFIALPILYLLYFGIILIILFIASLFINTKKEVNKPDPFARFLVSEVVKQINILANIKVHQSGLNTIPHDEPYTIVYNHSSRFDPMLIMDKLAKDKIICITKPGNIKIPITGPFIHKAGYIQIDRANNVEGAKAIEKAISYIKKGYGSICISPEGTRSLDAKLLPFRAGAFNVAKKGETPLVVIGFKNNNLIHKNWPFKRTNVDMDVLEVIPFMDIKDKTTQEISDYVHSLYEAYLSQ